MKLRYLLGALVLLLSFALTACGGTNSATSAPAGSITVNVIENDYTISSSITTFTPGQLYHFVVANNGGITHEFMIMSKDEGSMAGMSMDDMDKKALVMLDNIGPGDIKSVDYTFPESTAGTHPQFACYIAGHYESGMKQDITVAAQ